MLIVEVDEKFNKSWKPLLGTYRINTKLIDGINICEYIENNNKTYEGYVEINNIEKIILFSYSLSENMIEKEFYTEYPLPNIKFRDNWTKLIYDEYFKYEIFYNIFKYYKIDKNICNLMGINKCILIHGSPGVGKTTFCKALCQKLSIRTKNNLILREINCNKVFSRFYGESLKNLHRVIESASSNTIFVFDEADSLLLSRKSIMNKNEPNDSLRLINSLLRKIDKEENIFIFISNYKEELESAILDRCDIIVEMKTLEIETTYKLIKDTLEKLMELNFIEFHQFMELSDTNKIVEDESSSDLLNISKKLYVESPRKIKKMIFESTSGEKESVDYILKKIINKLE